MKHKHDEHELTRPLKEDEQVIEVANFIAVYRNFFNDSNINHFYDYWDWCQENGIKARTRMEAEDAHPLDKDDTNISMKSKNLI